MIAENLARVRETIESSMVRRTDSRMAGAVKLIAVTKNHDVQAMREAIDAGVEVVGENRVQETLEKIQTLDRKIQWHLIGHLQTNKAKAAVKRFDLIHSIDSERLAAEVDSAAAQIGKIQSILIQVNIAKEDRKFGVEIEDLDVLVERIGALSHLKVCGLMTIMPHVDNVETIRPLFRQMYEIFSDLKQRHLRYAEMRWLSMGMSNDYQVAIEEGANMVRIGTSIFGQRQYEPVEGKA